jgi:hypothetical protein
MIVALAGIGTAVALYPIVKRRGEARAVGFVASRILEAATIYAGIVSLMSLVTLRRAGAGAGALFVGQGLAAQYQWTFFFSQSLIPAVNGVLLGSLLYQSRLVPRWLPVLAFIGAVLLVASWFAILAGFISAVSPAAAVAALPIDRVGVFAGRLPDLLGLQSFPNHCRLPSEGPIIVRVAGATRRLL